MSVQLLILCSLLIHIRQSNERLTAESSLITNTDTLSTGLMVVQSDNALDLLNNSNSLLPGPMVVQGDTDLNSGERSTVIGVGDFSQSVACIATRFEECSSTLLDKLWYLYSYINN